MEKTPQGLTWKCPLFFDGEAGRDQCFRASDLLYLLDDLVDVLRLWQLQRSLHLVINPVDILHLVNLVSLRTESGES